MARFGMVIDTTKCVGCMDCVVACKTENDVPEGFCRDWITEEASGRFPDVSLEIRSERCNHCDNPPCVYCCPTGASHIEDFGRMVQIEAKLCIGCKACTILSLPFRLHRVCLNTVPLPLLLLLSSIRSWLFS